MLWITCTFNNFYNVSEGYSRTLSLYKWHVSLHFYLTYHSVFPNPSLPPVMVVEGEGEAAWTLSLLHLILSSSFPFCFISSNLLPHSFPVGPLFGSVFFDLIHNILCLSLFSVPFCFTKFLSLLTSIKFFLLGFLNAKNYLYHLFTDEDNKFVFWWIKVAMQIEWFIYLSFMNSPKTELKVNKYDCLLAISRIRDSRLKGSEGYH